MKQTPCTQLVALPALQDNYIWVLHDQHHAAVVDPGEAEPVLAWLRDTGRSLAAIIVTHHHWDHTHGIAGILAEHPVPVIGPAHEQTAIDGLQTALQDNETYRIDEIGLTLRAMHVPGHTLGATAFYCADVDEDGLVLTGDTLFMSGCGRLFEGTPAQMHASLQRLAALPASTRVYCGHEYSLANLAFAQAVEPDNPAISRELERVRTLRQAGAPSLPSTIAIEREVNPFLRCAQASVARAAARRTTSALDTPVSVFATLRQWKDEFRAP